METPTGWRSRTATAQQQTQTPNELCTEIAQLLLGRIQDGTISIPQLQKIRDLATNRAKLISVLPWL
ncbi:MAG: hypothetical protein IIT32_08310 [Bacteroidales bacterium]|nr:hypothetical protein [Bacteroidales bacterium]